MSRFFQNPLKTHSRAEPDPLRSSFWFRGPHSPTPYHPPSEVSHERRRALPLHPDRALRVVRPPVPGQTPHPLLFQPLPPQIPGGIRHGTLTPDRADRTRSGHARNRIHHTGIPSPATTEHTGPTLSHGWTQPPPARTGNDDDARDPAACITHATRKEPLPRFATRKTVDMYRFRHTPNCPVSHLHLHDFYMMTFRFTINSPITQN